MTSYYFGIREKQCWSHSHINFCWVRLRRWPVWRQEGTEEHVHPASTLTGSMAPRLCSSFQSYILVIMDHFGHIQSPKNSSFSLLPPFSPLTAFAPESLDLTDLSCQSSFPGRRALSTTVCSPYNLLHLSSPSTYLVGLPYQKVKYKIIQIPKCLISFQSSILACF